jgi:nitroreductase
MDTRLAIASKRDERKYSDRPIPPEVETRILDAARVSGNSQNKEAWQFVVVSDRDALAETVFAPNNIRTCALAVAIVADRVFDAGRAAQNMMLAAWNEGVISCPNGIADADTAERIVGAKPAMIVSFGYPQTPRNPEKRSADEWSARANRKPLDELVRRV